MTLYDKKYLMLRWFLCGIAGATVHVFNVAVGVPVSSARDGHICQFLYVI